MPDSKRFNDWFDKAKSEFLSANILFEHDGDGAVVAFLCHQTIEKTLKGYILKHEKEITEGHSLIYLCKKAAQTDPDINRFISGCAYVNPFYIQTRYPPEVPIEITAEKVQNCINIAGEILKICDVVL